MRPANPDSTKWHEPGEANSLHTPGMWEIRFKADASRHANQWVYDAAGDVMGSIPAAGSANFSASEKITLLGHYAHDVETFWMAERLGRASDYYEVRPIWIELLAP